jgi:hypothetical protein
MIRNVQDNQVGENWTVTFLQSVLLLKLGKIFDFFESRSDVAFTDGVTWSHPVSNTQKVYS